MKPGVSIAFFFLGRNTKKGRLDYNNLMSGEGGHQRRGAFNDIFLISKCIVGDRFSHHFV